MNQSSSSGAAPAQQNQIATAQAQLAAHGHDPGVRHGQLDWHTRRALRSFQGANGLRVTGVVDGPTNTALHADPSARGTRSRRARGGSMSGTGPMPPIDHANAGSGGPGLAANAAGSGQPSQGVRSMSKYTNASGVVSTGFRAPLIFSQAGLAPSSSANQVISKPQMDFRGENLVIDATTGATSSISMPTVGSIPQIIGGGASTTVPGTVFSPNQCGALDFEMSIAEQGNDITILVTNTSTTVTLAFACVLFGHQVMPDHSGGAATAGVLPPNTWRAR